MQFEEMLANRLRDLPSKHVSDDAIVSVINRLEQQEIKAIRTKSRERWGIVGAVVAAIIIVGIALHNLNLVPIGTEATRPNFPIVENPLSVTSTPLDTIGFRSTLQNYLEQHKLSIDGSSTGVSLSNQSVKQSLPALNKISELAVRWSQLVDGKYGGATVTFIGNGKPRIANVLVLKTAPDKWNIENVNNLPSTLSPSVLSHFAIYPGEWGGTGFARAGNDRIQFTFLSGFVVDPSITRVEVVRNDGLSDNLPIVNGVYGYFHVAPSGANIYKGAYKLRAYNKWGNLIFKQ